MGKKKVYSKKIYENIKKYIQIKVCEDCPFYIEGCMHNDRYLVDGFCDLSAKEVHLKSAKFPRWCHLDKKVIINDDEDLKEMMNGKDSIHSVFA